MKKKKTMKQKELSNFFPFTIFLVLFLLIELFLVIISGTWLEKIYSGNLQPEIIASRFVAFWFALNLGILLVTTICLRKKMVNPALSAKVNAVRTAIYLITGTSLILSVLSNLGYAHLGNLDGYFDLNVLVNLYGAYIAFDTAICLFFDDNTEGKRTD